MMPQRTMHSWSRAWPAPAKLNLYLHITGVREDGMHWLQTRFQLIELCDQLDFRIRSDGLIRLLPEHCTCNLVVRAAALLQQLGNCPLGADILLHKRIPTGGGLGGGSSDAATTLSALNQLWGLALETEQLLHIAAGLGSDVPLFVHGHTACAEGTGERLSPCPSLALPFLVLDPGVTVSTAHIYNAADLTRDTPRTKMHTLDYPAGHNDCEPVTCRLYPEVGRALAWLRTHAEGRMTGSGGCLYAAFASADQSAQLCQRVPPPWRAVLARGIASSPLLQRLQGEHNGV